MWTPQGYYMCSPDGERLIAWVLNRGEHEFAEILPALRFSKQLHRPDVVKKALDLADANEAIRQLKANDVDPVAILPPDIRVISPRNGHHTSDSTVIVEAAAKSRGGAVSWMELKQNGCTVRDIRNVSRVNCAEAKEFTAKWEVTLEPGQENVFEVVAFSRSCGTENVSEPIRVQSDSATSEDVKKFGTIHVLSIGVSQYKAQRRLAFASEDAKKIANKLEVTTKELCDKIEARTLLDEEVDDKSLQQAFLEIRKKQNINRDLAIVYLAGHGTADRDGDYHFLYHDCPTDEELVEQYGFSVSEFEKSIKDLCTVVLMLDTCSAGEVLRDASRIFGQKKNVMTFVSSDREEARARGFKPRNEQFRLCDPSSLGGSRRIKAFCPA